MSNICKIFPLSLILVPVEENFKVPICPSVPETGIFKSVFIPVTRGSRMTSFHVSQHFPVSQYFPEYYQHCLIRHLQISLWEMIRQLLFRCLFWERIHFPSFSHYSQSILRILPSNILGMFQLGWLPSFVAIGRVVLTLSWGQGKNFTMLVDAWPWPKVTNMATEKFSTHICESCGV